MIRQLILSVGVFLWNLSIEEPKVINNSGIHGLVINHSTIRDVQKIFPKGEKQVVKRKYRTRVHANLSGGGSLSNESTVKRKYVSYTDTLNGVSFYFGRYKTIQSISFDKESGYETYMGFKLGENDFNDLDSLYGKTNWNRHITGYCKFHGNLRFYPVDSLVNSEMTWEEMNSLNQDSITVDRIVLYRLMP